MAASFVSLTPQQAYAEMEAHPGAHMVRMNLVAIQKTIQLPDGISGADGCSNSASNTTSCLPTQVIAYTFNGTIPAPTIRAQQGDIIAATITDPASNDDNHGLDNHASFVSALNFLPTPPGTSKSYFFVATRSGAFEYHCEGNVNDLAEHVFRGMHGMVIVDPRGGYTGYDDITNATDAQLTGEPVSPMAKEIKLDFSEYYLASNPNGDFDWKKMYDHNATYSHINGIPYGYQTLPLDPTKGNLPMAANAKPLHFKVGDHVRFFVLNSGDWPVNFHIVGGILDRVSQAGMEENGAQTFNIGGSNSAIIDVKFNTPGVFVALNHDYSQMFKGQFAVIMVDNTGGPNPSNAVPPLGPQSIPQATTPYTFGTPLVWDGHSDLSGTIQSPDGPADTTN
jgi:nitrite reductase (NO-forming)